MGGGSSVRSRAGITTGGMAISWAELEAAGEAMAGALSTFDGSPSVVAAVTPNPVDTAVLVHACELLGATLLHVDPAMGAPELALVLQQFAPAAVAHRLDRAPWLPDGAGEAAVAITAVSGLRLAAAGAAASGTRSPLPPGGANVFLTSGSTGRPTGVVRSAGAVAADAGRVAARLAYDGDAPIVCAAPAFHLYGFTYGLAAARITRSPVRFVPSVTLPSGLRSALASTAATTLVALPYHYDLAVTGGAGYAVRRAVSAGAPLTAATVAATASWECELLNCYGSSEAGAVALGPVGAAAEVGWAGPPLPGIEVRLHDVDGDGQGELLVGSDGLADGRVDEDGMHPLPLVGGLYRTGDLATLDAAGGIVLCGRLARLINVAGKKVNPVELERLLRTHPAVGDAIVVGEPDRVRGAVPVAHVETCAAVSEAELHAWCAARLAPYKRPRAFRLTGELRRSATGKPILPTDKANHDDDNTNDDKE